MAREFYQECLGIFFYLSFLQLYKVCQGCMLKNSPTPPCSYLQTPCLLNMVCTKASTLVSSDQSKLRILQASVNVVEQTVNVLRPALEFCVVNMHTVHYFEKMADSRSVWSSPHVLLGWTFLILLFSPLFENLREATRHGQFMVKWCTMAQERLYSAMPVLLVMRLQVLRWKWRHILT